MKHRIAGRKLGRTSAHRLALLRNLSTSLFEREKITTTLAKAKELRPFAERLLTLSKQETLHARRRVLRHIHDREVVAKLFDTLSARYAERPGGYTRIVKLGPRRGDHAEMAVIELVGAQGAAQAAAADEPAATSSEGRAKQRGGRRSAVAAEEAAGEPTVARKKGGKKKEQAEERASKAAKSQAGRKKATKKKTTRKTGAGKGKKSDAGRE